MTKAVAYSHDPSISTHMNNEFHIHNNPTKKKRNPRGSTIIN